MLSFLQPGWLLLLLAAVPIVLLHMRRRQTIVVGSVQLWQAVTAPATSRRSRRLPPPSWPLLLQLLALLLASLALAQPRWAQGSEEATDHLVVILDSSVAMHATGDYEAATGQLRALLGSGYESVSVLLTTGEPAPVLLARRPAESAHSWLPLLPAEAQAGAADWAAVTRALQGIITDTETTALVVLAAPASTVPAELPGPSIEVQQFPAAELQAWLQETRVLEGPDGRELTGMVFRPGTGTEPLELQLSFRAFGDSDYLVWRDLSLDPDELEPLGEGLSRFTVPVELPVSGVLRVALAGAEGSALSSATHVIHVQPVTARVLVLGEAGPELIRALAAVEGVALYTAANRADADLSDFDLVVTSNLPLQAEPVNNVLSFIAPAADPLLAPLTTHWATDHVLTRGVNWSAVEVSRAARLPLLPGATEVFVGNGLPLVQARTVASGRQVVVGFDPDDSNWPQLTGFPAFISNVLHWIVPELTRTTPLACEVGRECELPGASLAGRSQLIYESGSELDLVQVGPSVLDFLVPLEPGVIWSSHQDGGAVRPLAVNAAAVPVSEQNSLGSPAGPAGAASTELWRPLVIVLIIVLLLEGALALSRQLRAAVQGAARRRLLRTGGLRLLAVAAIALTLFEPSLSLPMTLEQVVVLVSDEPGAANQQNELLERVNSSHSNLNGNQDLTLVRYAAAGQLTQPLSAQPTVTGSNLQAGMELALASLNPSYPGRIILSASGSQTGGDVRMLLPQLHERNATVDVLPLEVRPAGEVQVERVLAPEQVYAHDRFSLHATIAAEAETEAQLSFYRNGELVLERDQSLRAGRNIVDFLVSEADAAEVLFEVAVSAAEDTHQQNNRDGVTVQVLPPASVLVVTRQAEWGELFADALQLQGLDPTVVRPDRAPYYLDGWLNYRGIVLLDVPAIDLTVRQQELLEQAVAEHGRGLLILGGPNSFGPGGYFETVLERLSPLSSRVPQDAPNVALAFVLDRSGSMQQTVDGSTNRLDIARQATVTAAGLLHEESRVTVIVFDTEATVLVPLQEQLDVAEIEEALARLDPGGGTAIYPGMEAAFEQLQGIDAAAVHMIVMSDGLSQPAAFEELLEQITEAGITVSTVAIGDGADSSGLQRYARMGGGAFHATRDFRALPSILSQESLMLSGAPIEEHTAQPVWLNRDQRFVQGLPDSVPQVDGFVLTTAKDEATLHMEVSDNAGDQYPLLASWRYGNGFVMAFTSQGAGTWTRDWIARPDYPLFWSQALRNFLPAAGQEGLNVSLQRRGDELTVSVEVLDEFEQRLHNQTVSVNGTPLREQSTGRYEGSLPLERTGQLELLIEAGEQQLSRSYFVGYPAAWDFSLADPELLGLLAEETGGQVLSGSEPLFRGAERISTDVSLISLLLVLALVMFGFELIQRYDPALLRRGKRT